MQSPRMTRSMVLGKRSRQCPSEPVTPSRNSCDSQAPLTPDPTPDPKRPRISTTATDDGSNKENIPPHVAEIINSPSTRSARSLRRRSTEAMRPPPLRNTPRRYASTSNLAGNPSTPVSALNGLTLTTPPPSPPSALQPIYARARTLLRPTCNSTTDMAGRRIERQTIIDFITSLLNPRGTSSSDCSALYISGSPGTGKTALVNAVLHALHEEMLACGTTLMSVNCMALSSIDDVWERLGEDLYANSSKERKGRKLKETSTQLVERTLAEQDSKFIIILDELDHITADVRSLVSLFTLAQSHSSQLRLIGIANTHTLSTSTNTLSAQSLNTVKTLHFAPYTHQELLQIINTRLAPLSADGNEDRLKEFLPPSTLMLLSKKVAAQTGDVRAAFEVLRGAIDLAVTACISPNPLESPPVVVTPAHVLAALKAYSPSRSPSKSAPSIAPSATPTKAPCNSEIATKVKELGLHARLVLMALSLARVRLEAGLSLTGPSAPSTPSKSRTVKRTQSQTHPVTPTRATSVDTSQLYTFYSTILTREGTSSFPPVSRSEFSDLLGVLETVGLVALSGSSSQPGTPSKSGKRGFSRSSSFTTGAGKSKGQEVHFAEDVRSEKLSRSLGITDGTAQNASADDMDPRDEEVRAIWQRETTRVSREKKARGSAASTGDVFTDAVEH